MTERSKAPKQPVLSPSRSQCVLVQVRVTSPTAAREPRLGWNHGSVQRTARRSMRRGPCAAHQLRDQFVRPRWTADGSSSDTSSDIDTPAPCPTGTTPLSGRLRHSRARQPTPSSCAKISPSPSCSPRLGLRLSGPRPARRAHQQRVRLPRHPHPAATQEWNSRVVHLLLHRGPDPLSTRKHRSGYKGSHCPATFSDNAIYGRDNHFVQLRIGIN